VKRAASLAVNILSEHHDQLPGGLTLEPSGGGVFEVYYNDTPVFSKQQEDRFPEEGEVEHLLEHALGLHGEKPGPLAGGALDDEEMTP
jgi:selT/selW/selH-like putative selenoprotein